MAGRRRTKTPGRTALTNALNEVLRAAAGLDRIRDGAGDALRHDAALALRMQVQQAIGNSDRNSEVRPGSRRY
jgi:hypothetical protein